MGIGDHQHAMPTRSQSRPKTDHRVDIAIASKGTEQDSHDVRKMENGIKKKKAG